MENSLYYKDSDEYKTLTKDSPDFPELYDDPKIVNVPLKKCDMNDVKKGFFHTQENLKNLERIIDTFYCVANPEKLIFFRDKSTFDFFTS